MAFSSYLLHTKKNKFPELEMIVSTHLGIKTSVNKRNINGKLQAHFDKLFKISTFFCLINGFTRLFQAKEKQIILVFKKVFSERKNHGGILKFENS